MLAAVGGLAFAVAALLKLTSYLAYFMPLPVVLSAMRNGPAAGQMTTLVTSILLLGASLRLHTQLCNSANSAIVLSKCQGCLPFTVPQYSSCSTC